MLNLRPRIIIRAFTLRRDAATALLLARQLESLGCDVIVASGRDFVRTMKFWSPDIAVVNTVGQIDRCAQLAPNASIVMLPGEGANAKKHCDAIHLVNSPGTYERVEKYLLWGKATEDFFRELLPEADHSKLFVCGNPRLDLAKYIQKPRLPHGDEAKTIGFIGRFHILNRYNAVPAIFSMQLPEKLDGVMSQVENFFCMITLIRRIITETDYQISVRPHPLEAPEGYSFLKEGFFAGRVEVDDSLDVAAWVARQDVIVAPSSQSFYEAYVLGVPIINVDPLAGNEEQIRRIYPNSSLAQKVSHTPQNYDDAMELIKGELQPVAPVPEIEKHLDEFHSWSCHQSATMAAAEQISAIAQRKGARSPFRIPASIMRLWDRLSFYKIRLQEPLHPNFNYHYKYHKYPMHLDAVLSNIKENRSILSTTPPE